MTNLKLPTIAREVRLGFRNDSDLNQTLHQPSVNTLLHTRFNQQGTVFQQDSHKFQYHD